MKPQTSALVFCALLLTTFGHEHLHAYQAKLHQQQQHLRSHHHNPLALFRDNTPDTCGWICPTNPTTPTNNTGQLVLIFNETTNIIAVVNITAKVAFAIDINANLVALFNGTSGAAIVINLQTRVGVSLTAGAWLNSHESFEVYINSLTSLQIVFDLGLRTGHTFNEHNVTEIILNEIGLILINLSSDLAIRLRANIAISLQLLLQLSIRLHLVLTVNLKGFLIIVGSGVGIIRSDLIGLITILEGLGELIASIQGGIAVLIQNHIRLDLILILQARTSVEILVYVVRQISVHVNIEVILGAYLHSVEKLFQLLATLSGNVSSGLGGLLLVIYQVISVANNNVNLDVLIDALIRFSISGTNGREVSVSLHESLQLLISLLQGSSGSSSQLSALIQVLVSIQNGNLTINGLDVSAIIGILLRIGSGATAIALNLVVEILIALRAKLNLDAAIAQLLFVLIVQLGSRAGVAILIELIPSLHIDVNVRLAANPLVAIFAHVDIATLIRGAVSITAILSRLPVIGDIFVALSVSVKLQSHGSLSLEAIMHSLTNAGVVVRILAFLSETLHFKFGLSGILPPIVIGHSTEVSSGSSVVVTSGPIGSGGFFGGFHFGDKKHHESGHKERSAGHHHEMNRHHEKQHA